MSLPNRWLECLLLCACAASPLCAGEPEAPADPHVLHANHAPTPFTADEIREGCPNGRVSTFLQKSARGEPVRQTFLFGPGDATHAVVAVAMQQGDGAASRPNKGNRVPWKALQGHASFPAKATRITEEIVEIPLGRFACLVYSVKAGNTVHRFCFAKVLPGPPVLHERRVEDKIASSMTLVAHRDGTEARVLRNLGLTEADAASAMSHLDKDQSGEVTLPEFPGTGLTALQAARAFARADRDANGRIDAKELARLPQDWATPAPEQDAEQKSTE